MTPSPMINEEPALPRCPWDDDNYKLSKMDLLAYPAERESLGRYMAETWHYSQDLMVYIKHPDASEHGRKMALGFFGRCCERIDHLADLLDPFHSEDE